MERGPLSPELCTLGFVTILLWKGLATPPTANLVVRNAVIENRKVLDIKKT